MPQVPISQGPAVREAPLQGGYQTAPNTGAAAIALGLGVGSLADAANNYAVQAARNEASAADTEIAQGWLAWDAEARRKYRGKDVDGYLPAATEWWGKAAETYGQRLSPLAQQYAGPALASKRVQALGSVTHFVGNERERHADELAASEIASAIQFGVSTGGVAGAAEQVRRIVRETGARKHWETAQVERATVEQVSGLHLAHIARLAESDAAAASAYYQANKAEIGAMQQTRVEDVLRKEGDNQYALQRAAELAPLPFEQQLAEIAKIADPQRRAKTEQQVKLNHGMAREAQREREAAASDQAWQLVGQGKRVPELLLGNMNGRERVQLGDYLRQRAERAAAAGGDKPIRTDPATHAALIDMMLNDPEAFKRERLAAHALKLSREDLEQFAAKQQALRAGKASQQDSMMSDERRIARALFMAGVDATKQPELAWQLQREIDERVGAESATKGDRRLTGAEKQAVIDGVLMDKVFIDEWGRDPEKPLALVEPDDLTKAYVNVDGKPVRLSAVPPADRQEIIAARRKRGLPVTEQAIVETWLKARRH